MAHKGFRSAIQVVIAAVFALLMSVVAVPSSASAASETESDPRDSLASPTDAPLLQADDLDAFWTPERMAAATPPEIDEPVLDTALLQDLDLGEPRLVEPVAPDSAPAAPMLDHSYATGRMFYLDVLGGSHSCSASAIASGNQSLVLTAAHCLYDIQWNFNVAFVPGYDNGYKPYGTWSGIYHTQTVPTSWIEDRDFQRDVGMLLVRPNSNGQTLNQVVGGHGFATGQGHEVDLHVIGYPENHGDNQFQWHCWGRSGATGVIWDDRITMNCNFTKGASGGPWLLNYSATFPGLGLANGTLSTFRDDGLNFSPYFDDYVWNFQEQMSNLAP
ncbi:trypsin-like serine peptidase [Glycomyces dulcitolivorans]|uniref:trypsin-like serine peptidase n=1 Tax=Glycomyces dulcitolivorans TaxID=2200759 RepID=UPI001300B305|nr:trypsin-like serine protease [Glycomyces dulcitolivorans]